MDLIQVVWLNIIPNTEAHFLALPAMGGGSEVTQGEGLEKASSPPAFSALVQHGGSHEHPVGRTGKILDQTSHKRDLMIKLVSLGFW